MHGRQHRDRVPRHVHAGKNSRRFGNAGQAFLDDLRPQVFEVQEDMVLLLTDAAPFPNLDRHRPADHVP